MITAANARFPGSTHDAAIWRVSDIKNFCNNNYVQGDHQSVLLGIEIK